MKKNINKKLVIPAILLVTISGIGTYYITQDVDKKVVESSITNTISDGVDWSKYEVSSLVLNDESVTITKGGVYNVTGTISNGSIIINTTEDVKLVLNGVSITNESGSAILVENADNVYIETVSNTTSYITDSETYSNTEQNAAIYSSADLVFTGSGTLVVTGNYKDAIGGSDDILFVSGTYDITAVDDGIKGRDSVVIEDGTFTINAGGDGIKTTNSEDTTKGYIQILDGDFTINSGSDAIDSIQELNIKGGTYNLVTNGTLSSTSSKGLKSGTDLIVENGTFNIKSSDDAIHSGNNVNIKGGTFTLSAGDDGIHADNLLIIDGGNVDIIKSYEGLEGSSITINGGNIKVVASDDGVNVAGGADSSSAAGPGAVDTTDDGTHVLTITGGNLYVNSTGDGLDSNGSISMSGGTVVVNGPTDNGNGSLDYDGTFNITGGTLVASGSSGMAQMPTTSSTQNSIMIGLSSAITEGSVVSIKDSNGNEVFTYTASKKFVNLVISSSSLPSGTYSVYINGTSTSENTNGIYTLGGYSGGTLFKTFTISSVSTTVGTISNNVMGGSMR